MSTGSCIARAIAAVKSHCLHVMARLAVTFPASELFNSPNLPAEDPVATGHRSDPKRRSHGRRSRRPMKAQTRQNKLIASFRPFGQQGIRHHQKLSGLCYH